MVALDGPMKRRKFLAAAVLAGLSGRPNKGNLMDMMIHPASRKPLPRRPYKKGVDLSVVGFGGIILKGMRQKTADGAVAEAFERGVNYFDVAPSYEDGAVEEKLGPALAAYRNRVFLSCKTMEREAGAAEVELVNVPAQAEDGPFRFVSVSCRHAPRRG